MSSKDCFGTYDEKEDECKTCEERVNCKTASEGTTSEQEQEEQEQPGEEFEKITDYEMITDDEILERSRELWEATEDHWLAEALAGSYHTVSGTAPPGINPDTVMLGKKDPWWIDGDDFIAKWCRADNCSTSAPMEFKLVMAIYLLETIGNSKFRLDEKYGRLKYYILPPAMRYKNLGKYAFNWFIIYGPTRRVKKTTALDDMGGTRDYINDYITSQSVYIIPEDITPESMVKELSSKYKEMVEEQKTLQTSNIPFVVGSFVVDECSGFLEQVFDPKSPAHKFMVLLSRIYDTNHFRKGTVVRGGEDFIGGITALLATTEILPSIIKTKGLVQGFINRWLYIHGVNRTAEPPDDTDLPSWFEPTVDEIRSFLEALSKRECLTLMTLSPESLRIFQSEEAKFNAAHYERDVIGYYSFLLESIKKLAVWFHVSKMDLTVVKTSIIQQEIITEDDVLRALMIVEISKKTFENMMQQKIALDRRDTQITSSIRDQEIILGIANRDKAPVAGEAEGLVTIPEVMKAMKTLDRDALTELFRALIEDESLALVAPVKNPTAIDPNAEDWDNCKYPIKQLERKLPSGAGRRPWIYQITEEGRKRIVS
jgi:hypothetical protein